MSGIAISCPNCGATEHSPVERHGRRCLFCSTLYYPPAAIAQPASGEALGDPLAEVGAKLFVGLLLCVAAAAIALLVLFFSLR